jgi:hypothetical protein
MPGPLQGVDGQRLQLLLDAIDAVSVGGGGGGGGGGGDGLTDAQLRATPVRMALRDAAGNDIMGALANAAWDGTGNPASLIALFRAMVVALITAPSEMPPTPFVPATRFDGKTLVAMSTATTIDLVAASAGQKGRVHRGHITVGGATLITIKSGATEIDRYRFTASGGFISFRDEDPVWQSIAANEAITITSSLPVNVDGRVDWERS